MSALSELLHRARSLGVPGVPHPATTPVDLVRVAEEELAPVFDALDAYQRRAEILESDAEEQAAGRRAEAAQRVDRLRADAVAAAPDVMARAFEDRLEALETSTRDVLAAGAAEAERIDRALGERSSRLVDQIVLRALEMIP